MVEINFTEVKNEPYLLHIGHYSNMPSHLYYRGTLPPKTYPSVAIVGTRRPTYYGKQVTYDLAYKLAQRGIVIVSGLALGIDAVAHRAALDAGGTTVAVMAGGLDTIYPRTNSGLAREILAKGGALISEYPAGTPAQPFQFLARNRLVSGLADAVIVTEAAARSGTLSTVKHALDQGKEVFAVPGNITSVLSVGPNRLLRQGAIPVLSVDDIFEVIAPHSIQSQENLTLGTTPIEQTIIRLIKEGVTTVDTLQKHSNEPASELLSALTMLEITGVVRSVNGNSWSLSSDR